MNNSDIALFMEEILCSLCKQHLLIAEKADDLKTRIAHGGNVPLRWMMDSVYVRTDPAGNIKMDKEKSTERIDGAVATVMVLDRAIRNEGSTDSVYNERGISVI